ncbi:TPA: hypothetical protein ACGO8M_000266 [Streptococcus suis]
MENTLKEANHLYLLYIENKVLRKIKNYIKGGEEKETLSLRDKVLILKLHELFDSYEDKKVGLEKFLGISSSGTEDFFDEALRLFKPYFEAREQSEFLNNAIGKVRELKNKEEYNFLEPLRRDKIERRLRDILWHIIPKRKNIRYVFGGVKDDSESFYYIVNKDDFHAISEFLEIDSSLVVKDPFIFLRLSKKLKRMKVTLSTLEKEHKKLQEELEMYYQLAEFYFYA